VIASSQNAVTTVYNKSKTKAHTTTKGMNGNTSTSAMNNRAPRMQPFTESMQSTTTKQQHSGM